LPGGAFWPKFRAMDLRWFAVGAAVLVVGCGALRPADSCGASGTACGGDPTGDWALVTACQDPTYKAPLQRTYLGQMTETARQPPPDPAAADWCADLVYTPNGISMLNLPRDTPRLVGGHITYAADHTYGAFITSIYDASFDFSANCLTRVGFASSCADFEIALRNFATTLGGVQNVACSGDGANGCRCAYTIESDAAGTNLTGTWAANGNIITHFANNMALPSQVDYCAQGDQLTISGHDRSIILETGTPLSPTAGARTMNLRRIVCGDGFVDHGEACEPPSSAGCDASCKKI
jgi:hypothetical protein